MAEPFIKLYRKMLKWEWYDDPNTCRVFLHCLLRANWQEIKWHGVTLHPGQFITSLASLSKETGLSVKQVRTALAHLQMTGEVTSKCHYEGKVGANEGANKGQAKFRIITVLKWDDYQGEGKPRDEKGQGKGKVRATDKEYKEINNKRNIYSASSTKTAAEKMGGNTRKYSHAFFEELERQAALNPWGVIGEEEDEDDEDY